MSVGAPAVPAEPATPAVVQPDPGQGGGETGGAPYQAFLDRIPNEHHGIVEPVFRDWDAQTTRKFQEHAQFRDRWTPFADAGLDQYDPAALATLAQTFGGMNEDDYVSWLYQQAVQAGWVTPDGNPAGGQALDPGVTEVVTQALAPLQKTVEQLVGRLDGRDQADAEAAAQAAYAEAFDALTRQHGEVPADLIERFAAAHLGQGLSEREVIEKAFADYQAFAGQVETGVFRRKLDQPATPQTGGTPPPPEAKPQTMAEAHEAAMAHLRASRQ